MYKVSKSELILVCLRKFIPKLKKKYYTFSTIKYQRDSYRWKSVHLFCSPVQLEKFGFLRRCYKLSFSFIVALAIDLYCKKELLADEETSTDSYRSEMFVVDFKPGKTIDTALFKWGTTKTPIKLTGH